VSTDFGSDYDRASAVAVQRDGKLVVAGDTNVSDLVLARYQTDGTLDPTFGSGGIVRRLNMSATALALQRDGKIVLVGGAFAGPASRIRLAVARYNSDGSADLGFGSGGLVVTHVRRDSELDGGTAVAIQRDGKILAGGWTGAIGPHVRVYVALARYLPSGLLDRTFGKNGKLFSPFLPARDASASALTIQHDGKIVVAGVGDEASDKSMVLLARYRPNGSLDLRFGSHGRQLRPLPGTDSSGADAVTLGPNGKIVIGGFATRPKSENSDFLLARYGSHGQLDGAFGRAGEVLTGFGSSDEEATALAIQRDGKTVVVGGAYRGFDLVRYTRAGKPDHRFGVGGKVETRLPPDATALAVAIQLDGKLVVVGESHGDVVLARYLP
jgi:uncharacterized delta-60 repeat protein